MSSPSAPDAAASPRPAGSLRPAIYFVGLAAVAYAAWLAVERGISSSLIVLSALLLTAAFCLVMERLIPLQHGWQAARGDVLTDSLHALFSNSLAGAGRVLAATIVARGSGGWTAKLAIWPVGWPLPLQLALALLCVELAAYFLHLAQHRSQALWRVHAVHHSASRLYWLNQLRNHPLDSLWTGCALIPVVLMGAPPTVVTVLLALMSAGLMLQHANLDLAMGRLGVVLNLAEAHAWHHSASAAEASCNYGGLLLVFDHLFGTYGRPPVGASSPTLGLAASPGFPAGYIGQLAAPFEPSLWPRR